MVKLVDTHDSGSCASRRKGSTPFLSNFKISNTQVLEIFFAKKGREPLGSTTKVACKLLWEALQSKEVNVYNLDIVESFCLTIRILQE